MAIEKVININVQGNADEAVGSLRSQLRTAQAEVASLSDKFGATSQAAIDAAKRAGELKDKIGDAKALTDAFNPDAKFKALSSSLAGVAGGFAAVQGGMALFGAESKDVEKTLLKVQAAMALSQGLQAIGESVDSFKQLSAVIQSTTVFQKLNSLATAAAAVVQRVFTGAVETTTVSFNALKTAIVSTGIGALVIALGFAIQYINSMGNASEEAAKKQDKLNDAVDKSNELLKDELKGIDYVNKSRKNRAIIAGESADEIKKIDEQSNEEKLAALKKNEETQLDLLTRSKGDRKKQEEAYNAAYKAYIEELNKQDLDRTTNAANEAEKAAAKKVAAQEKATQKAIEKAEKEAAALKKIADDKLAADMKSAQDALNIVNELNQNKETPAQKEEREFQEKKLVLDENNLSIQELTKQHNDAMAQISSDNGDAMLAELNSLSDAETANKKANADAQDEIEKRKASARQQYLQAGSNTLRQASQLLGESTTAGKAAAVAAATIETYQSAVSSYNSLSGIPIVGPALGAVAAGVAVASGIMNVKKILSVKTPGGGGGGGAGPVASAVPTPPSFNVVGSSGVNQLAGAIGTINQEPVKAYVVSGDMTSQQSVDRNIRTNASFGG